jgi:phycocyanobilin lyase beta subunit
MTHSTHPTSDLIRAVDEADSAAGLVAAVYQLAAARDEAAIPTLIRVLGFNNPGAAVAAVDGLIRLGDRAVPVLLEQLDGYNYGARAWAIRAIAGIGDPRALAVLLEAAQSDFALSVRRAAARGLGILRWHILSPEQVQSAQTQVLDVLMRVSSDPEWVVRYAAVVSLQALAIAYSQAQIDNQPIIQHLHERFISEDTVVVRTRIQWALAQLEH